MQGGKRKEHATSAQQEKTEKQAQLAANVENI